MYFWGVLVAMTDEMLLARLDERTKQIYNMQVEAKEENKKEHSIINEKIDKLTIHVNHENELMDKRITSVELCGSPTVQDLSKKIDNLQKWVDDFESQKKGANLVYQVCLAGLGIAFTVVTVLEILGFI